MTDHSGLPKVGGIVSRNSPIIESSEHSLPTEANFDLKRAKKLARLKTDSMVSPSANANSVGDQDVKPAKVKLKAIPIVERKMWSI